MIKVEIKKRKIAKFLKVSQVYGVINEENNIRVNGSVLVNGDEFDGHEHVKIYANLCNEEGAILYVIHSQKNYKLYDDAYYSFSMRVKNFSRYFDIKELRYVEIYAVFDETDC